MKFQSNFSQENGQLTEHVANWYKNWAFWSWSGAREGQSYTAWQILQNEPLVAKIGFDTSENLTHLLQRISDGDSWLCRSLTSTCRIAVRLHSRRSEKTCIDNNWKEENKQQMMKIDEASPKRTHREPSTPRGKFESDNHYAVPLRSPSHDRHRLFTNNCLAGWWCRFAGVRANLLVNLILFSGWSLGMPAAQKSNLIRNTQGCLKVLTNIGWHPNCRLLMKYKCHNMSKISTSAFDELHLESAFASETAGKIRELPENLWSQRENSG